MSAPFEHGLSTPFCPLNPSDQYLNESIKAIPKYLFRVSDPSSPGITSLTKVCSPAARNTTIESIDLYRKPSEEAAQILNAHLWWHCTSYGPGACNLMSWTSSLLFALQYGFYRHKGLCSSQHSLSEIKILMVDTRQFDRNVFARDFQILAAFKGASGEHNLGDRTLGKLYEFRDDRSLYNGEYLSQGKLILDSQRSCQISLQELVGHGLFSVSPRLANEIDWRRWARRVKELRSEMHDQSTQLSAVVIQAAVGVAMDFGRYKLPVAMMLLSLSPYAIFDSIPSIYEVLIKNGFEDDLGENTAFSQFSFDDYTARLPEMARLQDLSGCIAKHMALNIRESRQEVGEVDIEKKSTDDLIDGFSGLSIRSGGSAM